MTIEPKPPPDKHPFTPVHYREMLATALAQGYRFNLFGEPIQN